MVAGWPIARATLISIVIAIGLLHGCPLPPAGKGPDWARGVVSLADRARDTLLAPVSFIGRDLDITQRWSLFRGANSRRFRLYVEGQSADRQWHLLYRAGDADHAEYVDQLEYRRIRGSYNPKGQKMRGQYPQFADWMTARVLAEHPAFIAARTRFEKITIDGGSATPTGEFDFERVRTRRDNEKRR